MIEDTVDRHLVDEVLGGNKQAFNVIVLKYQYRIFKIVSRYVRDPSEVMDIAQEAFVKAYKALDQFRGESTFYTWLYRIAINTAKNYVMTQGRRIPDLGVDIEDMENFIGKNLQEGGTPERMLICDEMEDVLVHAIDLLPEDLRKAMTLRDIEGLTYDEISTLMHCPVGTVRSRIHRAREEINHKIMPFLSE